VLCRLALGAAVVLPLCQPQAASAKTPGGVQKLPGEFVFLRDVDPTILQDIRYATTNNFTGRRLAGYEAGECIVKREVALALQPRAAGVEGAACR